MGRHERKRIALVTGANRGLGFETSRQLARLGLRVLMTGRDEAKGREAAHTLASQGLDVLYYPLDVVSPQSVGAAARFGEVECGGVDVLVNNAGVMLDGRSPRAASAVLPTDLESFERTYAANLFGPVLLCQALVPGMRERGWGRVVNVSSGLGQLADMRAGWPAYRSSKAALNALTRVLAAELSGTNVLVNSVDPGWVRTDMGGSQADRSTLEGSDTIVWAATLPDGGPTGGFFRDRQPIPW
ncbi:MAG TPA: short-chain dehydrogenase [Deltaproteobacteria bacterium]|jgi:NAD(P)-dependent dehydrogenase (short-subunit alcohol dehydrogenase family)|nr:short-chain dehydrogenase [Deltaproteobacteria bacterium]